MNKSENDGVARAAPPLLLLFIRLLLASEFLVFGALKLRNSANMSSYIESFGLPGELVWPAAVFQLVTGVLVVLGLWTRYAALALAVFCLFATGIFHSDFTDLGELAMFLKDLAAAGGFLLLVLVGPGAWSLDARRAS